jgi:hypothetical protein
MVVSSGRQDPSSVASSTGGRTTYGAWSYLVRGHRRG